MVYKFHPNFYSDLPNLVQKGCAIFGRLASNCLEADPSVLLLLTSAN